MEPTLRTINAVISALFFICYTYQFLYIPLVLLKKRRPLPRPAASHRYAVLIAARNEENVIAGLLDSLAAQTYDMSLVTVFVAADNCTDSTAAIARAHGAVVYERFNHVNVGKGYALDFLLQHIGADYPEGFDGYFVFDADNILSPDYLERMNESFSAGNEIVTEMPDDPYVKEESRINKMNIRRVDNLLMHLEPNPTKLLMTGEPTTMIVAEEELAEQLGDKMDVFRSAPFFLELVPKGIDKAQSLLRLLAKVNLTPADMIAFGDGYNDLSMLRLAGMGVAMSNAAPEVRSEANYVTLSNEEDGVAVAINKLCYNNY